jgi:hypothetical protein
LICNDLQNYSALHLDFQVFRGWATNIVGALHLGIEPEKQGLTKVGQKMRCPKAPLGARIFVEKTR